MAAQTKLSAKGRVWHNGKELSEDLKRLIVAELIEGAASVTRHIPDNVSLRKISGKFRLHHTTISNTWLKGPVKLILQVKIARSLSQSASNLFHSIISSLPM